MKQKEHGLLNLLVVRKKENVLLNSLTTKFNKL